MYSDETKAKIESLFNQGLSGRKIADLLSLSKSGVNYYLASLEVEGRTKRTVKPVIKGKNGPKILLFDLESTPSIAAVFGRFKTNISLNSVIQEGGWLLSAAWKFLGEDKVHSVVLTPEEALKQDDSRIVAELYEAFEDSDIVVAHNLLNFDLPLFRTRLIMNRFPVHKSVKKVDTLQIAKKLKFNSNKLDGLAQQIGLQRKLENSGMPLWLDCMQGKPEALKEMRTYNEQDIVSLEEVYLTLRAFDTKAPNASHYHQDDVLRCHVCGSHEVEYTGNSVFTAASEFKEVQCKSCGTRSRDRKNTMTSQKRKSMLTNNV
jgi:hypothetical protein